MLTLSSYMLFRIHFFLYYSSAAHRDLHSFPTRRSSDLARGLHVGDQGTDRLAAFGPHDRRRFGRRRGIRGQRTELAQDRKSTRLNSSHLGISYAVFCLKKKKLMKSIIQQPDV